MVIKDGVPTLQMKVVYKKDLKDTKCDECGAKMKQQTKTKFSLHLSKGELITACCPKCNPQMFSLDQRQ
jgi:RNase P subunit RPR2